MCVILSPALQSCLYLAEGDVLMFFRESIILRSKTDERPENSGPMTLSIIPLTGEMRQSNPEWEHVLHNFL
jgi:hypothetical protein